jgi:VCBS repeat-containing protein
MMLVVAPLLLSLTLAAGLEQTKPDFSGRWTKIHESRSEAVETMTITQTADTLTVEATDAVYGVIRVVTKLDGSESKNVIKQPNAPEPEYVQVSTTTWDGDSLVTRNLVRHGPVPFVLTTVMRLEGATLVIHATQMIEATGAVHPLVTVRYSK